MQAYLAEVDSWPKRWTRAATLSDYMLPLSAAELKRLNEEVDQLVESYRRAPRRGDEHVVFQMQSFPLRLEGTG
jgi:hypothetical protein